jgi:Na+/H+ antiporter NhaD/arsenite permease-like protein
MLGPIIVFLIAYVFIATEWVDKTMAALVGAGVVIFMHFIDYEAALHAVDLNVLFLLIGMMVIVGILSETGVFEWLSIKLARLSKGNGTAILIGLLALTAVLSAFLDNVTTVILIAPITILLTQILEIPTVPILILEAIFSNIGGTATLVGDPPNILIGSKTAFGFNDFLINLGPVVLVILAVLLTVVAFAMKRSTTTGSVARERIARSRPGKAIIEPKMLRRSLFIFGFVLAGFFLGRPLNIEPGLVALVGAVVMVVVCRVDINHALRAVEWDTILFFAGLFMLVAALEVNGVFTALGEYMLHISHGNLMRTTMVLLWFSAIASAIVNNIPLVMAMIQLVQGIVPVFAHQMGLEAHPELIHAQVEAPLFWALALGVCLGGNGSLVGASANVVVAQIANRNNYPITFWNFTKYGFPFMICSLLISTGYLWLRYFH